MSREGRQMSSGPRRLARRYAVLGLYQWQLTGQSPAEIVGHFAEDPEWLAEVGAGLHGEAEPDGANRARDRDYDETLFKELVLGVPREASRIDEALQTVVDRPIRQVDPVERAILRLATYEMLFCPAVPYQVAINEAVELAKELGAEQGHRYVNGVLDRIAQSRQPSGASSAGQVPQD